MKNNIYYKKSYIAMEIISYLLYLACFIISFFFVVKGDEIALNYDKRGNVTSYGSPVVLIILTISMLLTNVIMTIAGHIIPPNWKTSTIKPKPERLFRLNQLNCLTVVLVQMEMAIMTVGMIALIPISSRILLIYTTVLSLLMVATAIYMMIIIKRENNRP